MWSWKGLGFQPWSVGTLVKLIGAGAGSSGFIPPSFPWQPCPTMQKSTWQPCFGLQMPGQCGGLGWNEVKEGADVWIVLFHNALAQACMGLLKGQAWWQSQRVVISSPGVLYTQTASACTCISSYLCHIWSLECLEGAIVLSAVHIWKIKMVPTQSSLYAQPSSLLCAVLSDPGTWASAICRMPKHHYQPETIWGMQHRLNISFAFKGYLLL